MRDTQHDKSAGARLFQTLAADGAADDGSQFSLPRKVFVLFVTALLFVAAPLAWVSSASGSNGSDDGPQAVLVKSGSGSDDDSDDDDDTTKGSGSDNSGKGKDDDTDDGTDTKTGTKTGTKSGTGDSDDDTGGGTQTRGKTGEGRDDKTGKETQNKDTDRIGLDTGKSTRGETDRGDKTGKTERV